MKSRRFVKKRRRKEAQRVADRMAALQVSAWDRGELDRFKAYLSKQMDPSQRTLYENGKAQTS